MVDLESGYCSCTDDWANDSNVCQFCFKLRPGVDLGNMTAHLTRHKKNIEPPSAPILDNLLLIEMMNTVVGLGTKRKTMNEDLVGFYQVDSETLDVDGTVLETSILVVHNDEEMLVRVLRDGTIKYGPNYDPDEAAKTFWEAMSYHAPQELKHE